MGAGRIMAFQWTILQPGELPLRPGGAISLVPEHRCTVLMVWPDGQAPTTDNTLLVDPCFTQKGYHLAMQALQEYDLTLMDIQYAFITHPHGDHMPHVPITQRFWSVKFVHSGTIAALAGLEERACPGHDPMLLALILRDTAGKQVWAVGDAILDEEWLRAWGYYWPNGYVGAEVIQTWHSVAAILAEADVIIPGHGPAIEVNADLMRDLLASFSQAFLSEQCPAVAAELRARLDQLTEGSKI
jgi:glyoxylase-like metal-dependent hydrolase (beta-lactamase superfamily II)